MSLRFLILNLIMAFFTLTAGMGEVPKQVFTTTHKITETTVFGQYHCGGVAYGHHAIMTASHCEEPTNTLFVDDQPCVIKGIIRDGYDHTIYLLSGIEFKDLAEFGNGTIEQGDDIFLMGNPDDDSYILRKGYYAGVRHNPFGLGSPDEALFDFNGFFGDSGSGLFNTKGELVGITSAISTRVEDGEQMNMMGAFALHFTAEQLDKARTF